MKRIFPIFCLLNVLLLSTIYAQFENSNSGIRFENTETNSSSVSGFEMPAVRKPSLNNNPSSLDNSSFGKNEPKKIDVTKGDGLLDYKTNNAPKYFTKDKEAKQEYGSDQNLGDVKTSGKKVTIMYRDHEFVDGDRIRVFLNDDVIESNVYLDGNYNGMTITLQDGFNRIDFQALNQGTSGPNTAQLKVIDENGTVLSLQEWNLLTGRKATIIVVKD